MSVIKELRAGNLNVKVFDSRVSMGIEAAKEVADKIKELLAAKSEINMIFAAAPSQNEFLKAIVTDKQIDWSRVNAFHLDEYVGLDKNAPQGFGNFLKARIFGKVNFKSVNLLNGNAKDIDAECERYSELFRNNPIDIACIGIGENGHIAFNDPHVSFFADEKLVKVVELDIMCRQQQVNDGCFSIIDNVPTHALTLTVPAIMSSTFIYCMVPSKTKSQAVFNTINGEIREKNPASIMKLHKHSILFADNDSGSLIAS